MRISTIGEFEGVWALLLKSSSARRMNKSSGLSEIKSMISSSSCEGEIVEGGIAVLDDDDEVDAVDIMLAVISTMGFCFC